MKFKAILAVTWMVMLGVVASAVAQPDVAKPTIHRVTVDSQSGVLTITGGGLGEHLVVTVEGTPVPLLPGATGTQVEVAPPPALLTTAGTYRLTVVDPTRQIGDAFVVAISPERVGLERVALNGTPTITSGTAPVVNGPPAVSPAAATVGKYVGGPSPLTVIEDSGFPWRTAIGSGALSSNTTGFYNTASGINALYTNTTGSDNTANGAGALFSNTTGAGNTASGRDALVANTTGSYNTASGTDALYNNTTGADNTASGAGALFTNTTGYANTAGGRDALVFRALYSNTTGANNTASGTNALFANTDGVNNTADGAAALFSNTTGGSNTATGAAALYANTTGQYNTALGFAAGADATTGSHNVFLGANVSGTASDAHTLRLGVPYDGTIGQNRTFIAGIRDTQLTGSAVQVFIHANGQLGTLTPPIVNGTVTVPVAQLQQQLQEQQKINANLQARIARLEALLQSTRRK
jgi:hypothetical protein